MTNLQKRKAPADEARREDGDRRGALVSRIPLVLLVALAFYLGCFEMGNFDIWWHLRTGQLIPERGVPTTDWYGFASEGNAWIDVHWGFQLVMSAIHSRFGVPGMIFAKAVVGALAFTLCVLAYDRRWPVAVQVGVWLPALLLMSSRLYVRPELFTLLYTAAYLCILFHAENKPRLLWLLPLVQLFWANFQGLFIFGPILLGMYWCEALLRIRQAPDVIRHLLPVTALVAVACCISPYRIGNVLFVFELWTRMRPEGQVFRENIAELMDLTTFWKRGGYGNEYLWTLVFLLGLSAVSVVVAWKEILFRRRLFRVLPLIAFGWLSWQATRNGNHFAVVSGTVISWNLGSVIGERPFRRLALGVNIAAVLLVAYFVVHGDWYERVGGHRRTGFRERQGFYSHQAMLIAGQPGMPDRAAVMHMGHAALYIFHNGPEKKVLFDGRLEVHTQSEFEQYIAWQDAMSQGRDWDRLLRLLEVDLLIVDGEYNHRSQTSALLHPDWRCIHMDDVLAVFVRRSAPLPKGVEEFDFRYWLFDGRLPLFQSPLPRPARKPGWWLLPPDFVFPDQADRYAERLYNLSLNMSERTIGVHPLESVVLFNALKQSQLAVRRRPWAAEAYRRMGMQYLLAVPMLTDDGDIPTLTSPWRNGAGTLFASAIHCLQLSLECDPNDYSTHVYLYEACSKAGLHAKALSHLRRILQLPADNPARIQLREQFKVMATQLENQTTTAEKSIDPEDLSFRGLTAYANAGLLDRGLERIEFDSVNLLSAEQVDQLGRWYLTAGHAEKAKRLYDSAPSLRPPLRSLRLACCAQVLGEFEQARRHYLEAVESTTEQDCEHFDGLFGLSMLNVLAADLHQVRIYAGRLEKLPQDASQRRLTAWLNALLPNAR